MTTPPITAPAAPAAPAVDLPSSVRALAKARAALAATEAVVNAAREEFLSANAELFARYDAEKASAVAARSIVEALALEAFARLRTKKLMAGVEIKLRSTLTYDKATALEWAKTSKMALLPESLDTKAFDKIAGATPLPFVQYGEVPVVNVASDLSAVLGAEE